MLGKVKVGSLANLRPPWRKGECPNPAGRPPNVPLARAYRVLLRSFERGDRTARLYVRRLAQALHGENTESISRGRESAENSAQISAAARARKAG